MILQDIIDSIETVEIKGSTSIEIQSIEYDSRRVKPGALFISVKGFVSDGNEYIPDAIRNGAVAVLTDDPGCKGNFTIVRVSDIRKSMASVAMQFYGDSQREMVMTGITGTNGKTTTSYMVKSIFDTAGMDCGLIGTINHLVAGEKIESLNTTPEAPDIHSYLTQMANAGQNACVMEVSSHALALSRVYGIQFRAAAFLNLSRDHLDFHEDFKSYLDAKSHLFSDLAGDSTAVVNLDDQYADHIIKVSRGANIITFGSDAKSDIYPKNTVLESGKTEITLVTPQGEATFTLSLPGLFNVSNAMAATGIGLACGIPLSVIVKGLENLKSVKGRYEVVDEGQDFTVVVDYAHSPDALKRILSAARETAKARLISVFGCGGVRDKGKRPQMGEISTRIADYSLITSDNPRTEDPDEILRDIVEGIKTSDNYIVIQDRALAIKKALEMAKTDDVVIIAGKGHEDYQIIGKVKKHFDDVETARNVLRALK